MKSGGDKVDGINRYVREFAEHDVIDLEDLDDGLDTPLYEAQYRIANSVALKWVGGADSENT